MVNRKNRQVIVEFIACILALIVGIAFSKDVIIGGILIAGGSAYFNVNSINLKRTTILSILFVVFGFFLSLLFLWSEGWKKKVL